MANSLNPQEQLALIYENLQEKLKEDLIEDIVLNQQRSLKIYWGTLPLRSCQRSAHSLS